MTFEVYGRHTSTTILGGIITLFEDGDWAIATVIFLASFLIPLLKLLALCYLSLVAKADKYVKFNVSLYKTVEAIGRWSMLDIYLLAILVAIMKLGPWNRVVPEPGALLFLFVVIFTMLASAKFDARRLWEGEHGTQD